MVKGSQYHQEIKRVIKCVGQCVRVCVEGTNFSLSLSAVAHLGSVLGVLTTS